MFEPSQLEKLLFFDIETAGQKATYSELPEKMQSLWSARSEILRGHLGEKYPDNKGKSDSELFELKAGLQAEFGRIVCISMGMISFEDGIPVGKIVSYSGEDEVEIIEKAFKAMTKAKKTGAKLCGHNIKRFDVPYLCKRAFIHKLNIPELLQVWDKKPWETSIVDTTDSWSFGAWQEGFASLDLLATVLGVESPKDDIKGDQVHQAFYSGQIERIATYCNKDVVTLMQIALTLSGLNQIEKSDIRIQ